MTISLNKSLFVFIAAALSVCFQVCRIENTKAESGADSVSIKKTKRYIRPCLYFNNYVTPKSRRHPNKQYRFSQSNLGFYMPLYTNTWFNKDSLSLSTFHLLATADILNYKPDIEFLNESYKISRLSTGIRIFYSNGNRSVFYFSVSPFLSQEQSLFGKTPLRFPMTFIYSRTVSKYFSYRLGITRSYTFGRALPIPIIGIRIGALDKLHANIQLPRNVSLDFPIGKHTFMSLYTRSIGGVYNVVTQDTFVTDIGANARLRRYELLHGIQFNFRTGKNVSFYLSGGFTSRRTILYTYESETTKSGYDFDKEKIPKSIFISAGISIRFGKAKKTYNDILMYDVMNLTNLKNTGLSESGPVDNDVSVNPDKYKKDSAKKVKYKDVEDLITDEY
jgi:hypothetical protein